MTEKQNVIASSKSDEVILTGDKRPRELPKGWVLAPLHEACKKVTDGAHYTPQYVSKGYPFVTIRDIKDETIDFSSAKLISEDDFEQLKVNCNPHKRDVLFSKDGTVGKVIEIDYEKEFIVLSSLAITRPYPELLSPSFLKFLLRSRMVLDQAAKLKTGTALTRIVLRNLKIVEISVPPLPEQHRIVDRIEELFTKLDAGVEALKQIKVQLKQYRQAVLKYAFEGKLTQEWREKHKDELEPVFVLLERIKEERKNKLGKKYKEFPAIDTSDLPKLPESWTQARICHISEMIQYGTSEKAVGDVSGIPVLRMGNIQDGKLIFENLKYFPAGCPELDKFVLQNGDVLFNRTNSAELVGKTAVYKEHHPTAVFASYLIRVRVDRGAYLPDTLSFFINSYYGRRYTTSVVSQQVGQANVNGTKLSFMPIAVPSLLEQHKMVKEIERCFSVADTIEQVVEQSLKQAGRMRQSILKKAFEGKLVAQNPNDEPAEKLLERIKVEKVKHEAHQKAKKKA